MLLEEGNLAVLSSSICVLSADFKGFVWRSHLEHVAISNYNTPCLTPSVHPSFSSRSVCRVTGALSEGQSEDLRVGQGAQLSPLPLGPGQLSRGVGLLPAGRLR